MIGHLSPFTCFVWGRGVSNSFGAVIIWRLNSMLWYMQ